MAHPAPHHANARFDLAQRLGVLFFFSGFPALIYQIVWQRALFRIFGVNIEAATIVVAAFMVGLGVGAIAGGWLSRRMGDQALLLLAIIELVTAGFGLVSLSIFETVGEWSHGQPLAVVGVIALALVIVPTLLMGATLPVLVAFLVRKSGAVGSAVGTLYFVNTLGAAAACVVAALALFPFLGMAGSIHVAVAVNLAVAAVALAWRRRSSGPSATEAPPPWTGEGRLSFPLALALATLGGFVSLAFEIFLFRLSSFADGSSAPAFALTLAGYLLGLALGARAAGEAARLDEDAAARDLLKRLFIGLAWALALTPLCAAPGLPHDVRLAIIIVATVMIARSWGMLLPWLAQRGVAADGDAGARVSYLYLANIVGSATGSIVTGFVLMDALTLIGVAQALTLIGAGAVAAVCFAARLPAHTARITLAGVATFSLAALLLPLLSQNLYARLIPTPDGATPVFDRIVETRSGVITATADGVVYGHGRYDGRFNTDLVKDTNMIVRPYALSLLHPRPERVLMIGLSTGSWARVIAANPHVKSLKVVEINPGYLDLIRTSDEVKGVLDDPKVELIFDDGRRWLGAHAQERFDVIVSNTTWHYRANVTNLLSQEFLTLAASRLAPGGVFFYNTTSSDRVQRTACATLPHGLRFTNHMAVSNTPLDVDFERWRETLLATRVNGKPVLDLARPADANRLDALMRIREEWGDGSGPGGASIEPCAHILKRTAGMALVTDDNMGTEWRKPLGLQ